MYQIKATLLDREFVFLLDSYYGGKPNTDLEISIPRSRNNCLLNQELNTHVSH